MSMSSARDVGGRREGLISARYAEDRVTIQHPVRGSLTLDCDMLTIEDGDLRAILFTT